MLLVWVTKFDKHLKNQAQEREQDGWMSKTKTVDYHIITKRFVVLFYNNICINKLQKSHPWVFCNLLCAIVLYIFCFYVALVIWIA
jgi:hypothetical protein